MGDDPFEPPVELPRAQLHNKFGERYKSAPPVTAPYQLPSQRRRGGLGSLGAMGVIGIAIVRAVLMLGHSSSTYDRYNYQIPNIPAYDPQMLRDLERQSQDLGTLHLYDPPPVAVPITAGESSVDTKMELLASLRAIAAPDLAGTAAQASALGELQLLVLDDNCAQMLAQQQTIDWPAAPPATGPSDGDVKQIELIHARIAKLCPTQPTKPLKPAGKTATAGAKRAPPPAEDPPP